MQRASSPYRANSPYRSTSPYYPSKSNQQRDYQHTYSSPQPPPADGSLAYLTSTGNDGKPQYQIFKAVRASYVDTISKTVVDGMQWVPVEITDTLPAGARPASTESAVVNRPGDERWPRLSERKQDLDKELQIARARDAQDRERRKSVSASSFPTISTSGSVGSGAQYGIPRSSYSAYSASSTSSTFSDLDRQMGNIDLRDRGKEYPNEKEGKISTPVPRPQKYTATEVSDRPRSPHPGVRPASRAEGPYGAATAFGAYNATGRPYSTAGYQPSTSPNPRPAEIPSIPGNLPYRATDPLPRSTTPSMVPRTVYPPGHVMEGQPILPQDRARMTPIPRGPSPAPPGPYNSSAVGLSQPASSPNISMGVPLAGTRGAPPQQLAAPEGFSRPVNGSHPFTAFEVMKIQDMEKFWSDVPRMPGVLMTHDVFEEDWRRLMHDMALAWAGKLPIPEPEQGGTMPKRSTIVADLVNLWNDSFFLVRGVELVLFRGKECRTGRYTGLIQGNLPYLEEPDDYISSEEGSIDDDSNSDLEYGGGRYQHPGYGDPQQQLAEIFEEGRRRKEAKLAREAERKRKRQERHRRRRERIRARKYALYLTYVPTSVAGGGYGGSSGYSSGSQYGGRY